MTSMLARFALACLALTVSATAALASGKPIPGIDIIVKKKPRPGIMATAVSDARGRFSVRVSEAGRYTIATACPAKPRPCPPHRMSVTIGGVALRAAAAGGYDFTVEPGRPAVLAGLVETIRLPLEGPLFSRGTVAAGDVNGDGQAEIAAPGPRGAGPGVGGQTHRIGGEPLSGTPVGLEGDPGSLLAGTGRTDANGNVTIGNLAPGRYFVFLADPSSLRGAARVRVTMAGAAGPLSGALFRDSSGGSLSRSTGGRAYVLDANGGRLVVVVPNPGRANARRGQAVVVNLSKL